MSSQRIPAGVRPSQPHHRSKVILQLARSRVVASRGKLSVVNPAPPAVQFGAVSIVGRLQFVSANQRQDSSCMFVLRKDRRNYQRTTVYRTPIQQIAANG